MLKPGDKVRCVDNEFGARRKLVVGEVYIVSTSYYSSIGEPMISVVGDSEGYYGSRFEKIGPSINRNLPDWF